VSSVSTSARQSLLTSARVLAGPRCEPTAKMVALQSYQLRFPFLPGKVRVICCRSRRVSIRALRRAANALSRPAGGLAPLSTRPRQGPKTVRSSVTDGLHHRSLCGFPWRQRSGLRSKSTLREPARAPLRITAPALLSNNPGCAPRWTGPSVDSRRGHRNQPVHRGSISSKASAR